METARLDIYDPQNSTDCEGNQSRDGAFLKTTSSRFLPDLVQRVERWGALPHPPR